MIAARAIGDALRAALDEDRRVILLGEDLADPYGGAFKVTRGLSTDFPGRVRSTPISEAAIAGLSAGLALSGYRPIAEIMFGDFLTLCFDQVVNHITKYEAMYNGKATCPVIIRTPSGGGRGYGPTHSQSLEKHFLGVPHLRVVASSLVHDPAVVLRALLSQNDPVLLIEHKLLYPLHLMLPAGGRVGEEVADEHVSAAGLPTISIRPVARQDCSFTVLAYGYQAELARRAISRLAIEEEIFGELIIPSQIAPIDWEPIHASVDVTRRLLVIEEGADGYTWGSEIAARVSQHFFGLLSCPVATVASDATVIPSSKEREAGMLMTAERVERAIRRVAA
jgi:acetoin:2,6-dichlorophenolindophenol oxidoreductase subunit beta